MRVLEFVLWSNCTLNCDFCNVHDKYHSTKEEQLESLAAVNDFLKHQNGEYSVLFVGGEIFNGLNDVIETELYKLYKMVILNNNIKTIYFNTNLLYKIDQNGLLYKVLSLANDVNRLEDIHFTTSDDYSGRWKNKMQQDMFYRNISYLRSTFPKLPIIVNTIMTKNFIHSEYNIMDYMSTHDVMVNLLPYININNKQEYLPTRNEYSEFIIRQREYAHDYIDSWVDMWSHDRCVEVRQYNPKTEELENLTEAEKPCGKHNANFSNCFADYDGCFLCYLENFK